MGIYHPSLEENKKKRKDNMTKRVLGNSLARVLNNSLHQHPITLGNEIMNVGKKEENRNAKVVLILWIF